MKKVRCAIYTRKSSEEGLEQDFNSLHAQRDACAAYVASQTSEGWSLLPDEYDDGGLSGGNMERPALRRLLADIEAGLIDNVVVYKVDRLTRSLLDFAKLVEAFDSAGVSFVSVTQSFNTTSSMGRLTLNMLLSFAQFEREVTAERIRDKIAASKQRGMWMGGIPPLGYEPNGRSLAIVDDHAEVVRSIFDRYLDLGNVRLLGQQLDDDGIAVPVRQTSAGKPYGGGVFSRGQLYTILKNPVYIGRIRHGEKTYPGQHDPIIANDLFDAVQTKLAESTNGKRIRSGATSPSLLAGKLFDEHGQALVATHAVKRKVRYRYYVSRDLQHGGDASSTEGMRLPAKEIEKLAADIASDLLADPVALMAELGIEMRASEMPGMFAKLGSIRASLDNRADKHKLAALIERIDIGRDAVAIRFDATALLAIMEINAGSGQAEAIIRTIAVRLKRTGLAMKLILPSDRTVAADVDARLVCAIARGRSWWQQMKDEPALTVKALAAREQVTSSYITRLVRLAFLSPDIVGRTLAGDMPTGFSLDKILVAGVIPANWTDQITTLVAAD